MNNLEHKEQSALIEWFDISFKPWKGRLFAIPNGGARHIVAAKKLKKEGVRSGVPDLFLPVSMGGKHGLFIEMKAKKGVLTEKQKDWIYFLNKQRYSACVCYGFDEGRKVIISYMGGKI